MSTSCADKRTSAPGAPRPVPADPLRGASWSCCFVGFAVAQGIGEPSVPSGDVDRGRRGCPRRHLGRSPGRSSTGRSKQTAARGGIRAGPEGRRPAVRGHEAGGDRRPARHRLDPGRGGGAGDHRIRRQVQASCEQIKSQNFRTEAEYQQFLERSGYTQEDVDLRVELQLLSPRSRQKVSERRPAGQLGGRSRTTTTAAKEQFELPETRDVRLVLNRDQAKVEQAKTALEADDSDGELEEGRQAVLDRPHLEGQRRAAARGSPRGWSRSRSTRRSSTPPEGEIEGPVKTPLGYYVFEVEKITPATTQPLKEVQSADPQPARAAGPGAGGLHHVRRRLRQQVAVADLLRLRLRDRALRQLQGQRPSRDGARRLLRGGPEGRPARGLPGAGARPLAGPAGDDHAAHPAGPAAAAAPDSGRPRSRCPPAGSRCRGGARRDRPAATARRGTDLAP